LEVVNLSEAGLADTNAPLLLKQLGKFPALKQLDVSANPGLRLLPIDMLRIAATLEAFKCDGCSLVLPPQSMFSTPEENPRLIRQLLEHGVLNLSAVDFTTNTAREIAALLEFYPALKQLDVSDNPGLRCTGAAVILSALSGKILLEAYSFVPAIFRVISDAQMLMRLLWKSSSCREQALWMRRRPCCWSS
jgi:hypothetical protein